MASASEHKRQLGNGGPLVSAIGFGAMGLSYLYGAAKTDKESREVVKLAVELGSNFIDTSNVYGSTMGDNERLLGPLLKDPKFRSNVFICTKFGMFFEQNRVSVSGKPEYVRKACEESLRNLQVDYIDLYYQHRVDRTIPIEETWGELKRLQEEGKVKYLGISEATEEEIRRANKVAKINALQIEFSPWTPDIRTNGILDVCRELGIAIVAYSPLGRGFLTGAYKSLEDLDKDDWRRTLPRFQGAAFQENLKLVDAMKKIATKKGCSASQLCLAWVLAQGDDFIPIPGTKTEKYLRENLGALDVVLTKQDIAEIDAITEQIETVGERYSAAMQQAAGF